MCAPAKHRACHDVDQSLGIESALDRYSDDFAQHLQGGRGHHVAEQLDEVRMRRISADNERPLSETVEQRLTALDVGWSAGGENEELARLGGIPIPSGAAT